MWTGATGAPYDNIAGIDPELNDPENGDYGLAPGSPAIGYGCRTFTDAGEGGDAGDDGGDAGGGGPLSASGSNRAAAAPIPKKADEIYVSGPISDDTVWSADTVNVVGDVTVVDAPVRDGERAVRQNDTSGSASTGLNAYFPSMETGRIGAWMRRASSTVGVFDIYLYGGDRVGVNRT